MRYSILIIKILEAVLKYLYGFPIIFFSYKPVYGLNKWFSTFFQLTAR